MKTLKILTLVLLFSGASLAQTGSRFNYKQLPNTVPQSVTVHLDSAQIVNLKAVPDTVIAAPGNGFFYVPLKATIFYHGAGHTPYTVTDGSDLDFFEGDFNAGTFYFQKSFDKTIITDTVDDAGILDAIDHNALYGAVSQLNNQPLVFLNFGTGEYTGGNGTMDITIQFYTVAIP